MPLNPYSYGEPDGGVTLGGSSLAYDMLNENLLTAANINLVRGNLDIGAEYSGLHNIPRENPSRYFMGGTGGLNFGTYAGTRSGDFDTRFMGRLSGKLGYGFEGKFKSTNPDTLLGFSDITDKGLAASGRLDLRWGRPGKASCIGGMCYAPPVSSRSIGLFGEYENPYSLNPGLRAGAQGHYEWLFGEGGYDFQSQSPFINAGLRIPIK